MSVRFKFRSSVGFDAVDLGGRTSISVRDLRARVVEQKNLPVCGDFRLVVSDAETGEAYEDEGYLIPDGSSVIIKRVPAVPENHEAAGDGRGIGQGGFLGTLVSSPSEDAAMDNFNDFGNDLYPALDAPLMDSDSNERSINSVTSRKQDDGPRCSESPVSRCQNLEQSNLSEALSKENVGQNYDIECDVKDNTKMPSVRHKAEDHRKLDEAVDESFPAMANTDLPTELQCSLCKNIFKEAVMIPCCQHSFCDKCIRAALVDKGCCPRCSSTKCRIEDLLPNLSLRHAIEHFLEAQIPIIGSDKVALRYAPDGESGIQAKEASCALSIRQLEKTLPHSPSVTGKGSNQLVADSACESLTGIKRVPPGTASNIISLNADKPAKSIILLHENKKLRDRDGAPEDLKSEAFGSGNFMKLPQSLTQQEEAMLTTKKKKGLIATGADARGALPPSRLRKGDRNCYICGSPDHLMRDCPAASNPYPCVQTGNAAFHGGMPGYGPTYWHSNSFPYVRSYANMYGAPGMLPFDPAIKSVSPFGIPYMSPFYTGLPVPWMGGMGASMISGAARPLSHTETMELQDGEQRHKPLRERLEREETLDDDDDTFMEDPHYPDTRRRLNDHKSQLDKDVARSFSDDESPRLHRKHLNEGHFHGSSHQRQSCTSDNEEIYSGGRKHERASNFTVSARDRAHCSERSHSDAGDVSDSSDHRTRERSKHRRRSGSKKHGEKRGKCGSDCNHKTHHRNWREMNDDGEKDVSDHRRHGRKHHSRSEATLIPDSSGDQRQSSKEEFSHSSRHSKHKEKSSNDQLVDDRWELVDGLNEGYGSEYRYHKHRRTH